MKKFKFTINGNEYDVEIGNIEDNNAQVTVNGTIYEVQIDRKLSIQNQKTIQAPPSIKSSNHQVEKTKPSSSLQSVGGGAIKSPLPATVIELHVKKGENVSVGQKLITLEAMKMENVINSEFEGTVSSINCSTGDTIKEGDTIMIIGE